MRAVDTPLSHCIVIIYNSGGSDGGRTKRTSGKLAGLLHKKVVLISLSLSL
jgi:hypothetical protein